MKKLILSLSAIIIVCLTANAQNGAVAYTEETELMSVVAHLADVSGYVWGEEDGGLLDYIAEVDEYFAPYRNHPAVKFAEENLSAWDFPMAFALKYELKGGKIIFKNNIVRDYDDYYEKISPKQEKKMTRLLEKFYKDSNFHQFFTEHEELYNECVEAMNYIVDQIDFGWYDSFFGTNSGAEFKVYLGLLNGPGNYAIHQLTKSGNEIVNALMGCCNRDREGNIYYGVVYTLPVLVHEFNHSFCNPLNEECWDQIKDSATKLFKADPDFYLSIAYGSPLYVMNETFVEASMIRYLMTHPLPLKGTRFNDMSDIIDLYIENDSEGNKFHMIESIIEVLDEREKNPDLYPTMREFLPRYIETVNAYSE